MLYQQPTLAAHAGTLIDMRFFAEHDRQTLTYHVYGVSHAVF
jgi:hypothetical protein